MKKLLVTLAAVLVSVSTFAQGTIKFNNRLTGQVDAPVSLPGGTVGAGSLAGATAQLYLIPAGGGAPVALTPPTTFRNTSAAAMFYVNEPLSGVIVPGVPAGSTANIQLRAWVGGSSYETATQFAGASNIIPVSLGGTPAQGAPIPDAVLSGLQGFQLRAVPEPSTIALGFLGAAALLYRRRK
jgi:hypothetical protein